MKLSVNNVKKKFNKLCVPAQFYLVLSLLGFVLYIIRMLEHKNKLKTASGLIIQVLIALIWTYILNWVCSAKYGEGIAWLLIFLPFIMFFGILILIHHVIDDMDLTKKDLQELADSAARADQRQEEEHRNNDAVTDNYLNYLIK